jgi:hypothetical protein
MGLKVNNQRPDRKMLAQDCKTVDDIVLHLVSHLEWIHETVAGPGNWVQKMGFRRSLFISQVWYNTETHEWAYHVSDDEITGAANMGIYYSFTSLLLGVAQKYSTLWELSN